MPTIAVLLRKGYTREEILRILEKAEDKKREQGRQRNIRMRERNALAPKPKKVHTKALRPAPPIPVEPRDPPVLPLVSPRIIVVAPAGMTIPLDFQPNMEAIMMADAKGLSDDELALEVRRFVDYYTSTGTRRQDWHAAFRCWLNSPFFEASRKRGGSNGNRSHLSQWEAAYAELDAYNARRRSASR